MNVSPLGNTGLQVPPIIFGSSSLGNLFQEYPKKDKVAILKEIFQACSPNTVFDTAGKYGAGLALEVLGDFLQEAGIKKEEVIINNKLGWVRVPLEAEEPTFEPGIWKGIQHDAVQKISYAGMMECFEKDNALMQGYQPQLISLHDPDEYLMAAKGQEEKARRWEHILRAYRALTDLKRAGKVVGIGVGAKDWTIIRRISREVSLDYVMLANSLSLYSHPPELMEFVESLRKKEVGIINAAIFHSGFLVGEDFFDYRKIDPDSKEGKEKFLWRQRFFETCTQHKVAPYHACIQFSLAIPGLSSIALSINHPDWVRKNIRAVNEKLPASFWQELIDKSLISDFPFLTSE